MAAFPTDYTPPAGYEDALTPARYRLLVDEAARIVAQRYAVARVEDGIVHLGREHGERSFVKLHSVIEAVAGIEDEGELLDAVHAHVTALHRASEVGERGELNAFAEARSRLAARVYPRESLAEYAEGGALVVREEFPGTLSLLMLDVEGAFTSVARDLLATWDVTDAEAFAAAHANAAQHAVQVGRTELTLGGVALDLYLIQEENYAASFALALGANTPEVIGEHGALVAVPSRAFALVLPLPSRAPKDVVERFGGAVGGLVRERFAGHGYPVSEGVAWLTAGRGFVDVAGRTPVGLAGVLGAGS